MLTKSKPIDFLKDPPLKVLCSVVLPLLLVYTVQIFTSALTSKISSAFVGADLFSVTGYLSTVMSMVNTAIGALTSAAWIVVSRLFAEKEKSVMQRQITTAVCTIILVTLSVSTIMLLLCKQILNGLHIPQELYSKAKMYFMLYSLVYSFSAVASFLLTVLNATGSAKRLLAINLFSTVNGVLLNVLVLVVCKAGIAGAAILPMLGYIVQILLYITLLRKESLFSFSIFFRGIRRVDRKVIWQIIKYASVIALQSLMCSAGYLAVSVQANRYLSTEYISVLSVSLPLASAMSALSTAVTIFCPQNFATGNFERLKKFFRLVVIGGILYGLVCFLAYVLLGRWYFGQLFEDGVIVDHGAKYWFWQGLSYPFLSLMFTVRYFLDAVGKNKYSLLSGLGELTGNLLCAFWLIPVFGNIGRSLSYPIGYALGAVMLVISYCCVRKKIYLCS